MKGFLSEHMIWRNVMLAVTLIVIALALPSVARWWQGDAPQEERGEP